VANGRRIARSRGSPRCWRGRRVPLLAEPVGGLLERCCRNEVLEVGFVGLGNPTTVMPHFVVLNEFERASGVPPLSFVHRVLGRLVLDVRLRVVSPRPRILLGDVAVATELAVPALLRLCPPRPSA